MKELRLSENELSSAIQRYVEDQGYYVKRIVMGYDPKTRKYDAVVTVEED